MMIQKKLILNPDEQKYCDSVKAHLATGAGGILPGKARSALSASNMIRLNALLLVQACMAKPGVEISTGTFQVIGESSPDTVEAVRTWRKEANIYNGMANIDCGGSYCRFSKQTGEAAYRFQQAREFFCLGGSIIVPDPTVHDTGCGGCAGCQSAKEERERISPLDKAYLVEQKGEEAFKAEKAKLKVLAEREELYMTKKVTSSMITNDVHPIGVKIFVNNTHFNPAWHKKKGKIVACDTASNERHYLAVFEGGTQRWFGKYELNTDS